jgi:hypothetical protein
MLLFVKSLNFEFRLLELALKSPCARMIQNEMFHLLFIFFQATLGSTNTFINKFMFY